MMSVPVVRMRLAFAIGLAVTIGAIVIEIPIGQAAVYYVDVKNPGCSDASGFGSEARPYCTLRYVSTIANPGDTFLIHSGLYSQGPTNFTKSGTATAPITYRAVGYVTLATQLVDENLQPTTVPNVYSMPYDVTGRFRANTVPAGSCGRPEPVEVHDGAGRRSAAPDPRP